MTVKNIIISCVITLCGFSFLTGVNGFAGSEFLSGDTITATKSYDNVYAAGANITVDSEVQKDLIAAGGTVSTNGVVVRNEIVSGGTVSVKSQVGGALIVAGGTVTINSPNIVGSARVAGGSVTISGNYNEDLLVAGGDVTLTNANVAGDVYVGAGTLTVQNSTIKGKIQGQYGELKGDDLKKQVSGVVDLKKVETEKQEDVNKKAFNYFNFSWEFSVIVVTLILGWILGNRNRLSIPSIKWGKTFGLDVLIGLGAFVLPGIVAIVLLILQLFPLALLLPSIVFLEIVAAMLVLPIYVGNFIKNTWNLKLATKGAVGIGYIILLGFSLLSKVDYLSAFGLVIFVFALAHIGFLLRTSLNAVNHYLIKR